MRRRIETAGSRSAFDRTEALPKLPGVDGNGQFFPWKLLIGLAVLGERQAGMRPLIVLEQQRQQRRRRIGERHIRMRQAQFVPSGSASNRAPTPLSDSLQHLPEALRMLVPIGEQLGGPIRLPD